MVLKISYIILSTWYCGKHVRIVNTIRAGTVSASVMLRKQMRSVTRAEEAWRTEAAWRTAMEDSLAVGIRARDLEGRLVYVNKTMADMVGRQPEELVGLLPPIKYNRLSFYGRRRRP